MTFADIKATTRRAIHARLAVPCSIQTADGTFDITARLHDKTVVAGDLESQGYPQVTEGVSVVILNREELVELDIAPVRNDRITIPDRNGPGLDVTVSLDVRSPYDGPITEKWSVVPV